MRHEEAVKTFEAACDELDRASTELRANSGTGAAASSEYRLSAARANLDRARSRVAMTALEEFAQAARAWERSSRRWALFGYIMAAIVALATVTNVVIALRHPPIVNVGSPIVTVPAPVVNVAVPSQEPTLRGRAR